MTATRKDPQNPSLAELRKLLKKRLDLERAIADNTLADRYEDLDEESDDDRFRRLMETPGAWQR